MVESETVIVGASAAGLATAACLQRAGAPFVLLEQTKEVGTAWRNHYERLHLHTSKGLSSLPGLPFPGHVGRYPSRAQVVEYLDSYAAKFALAPRFEQRVASVRREGEAWMTRTQDTTFRSRHVVVATGYTRVPNRPAWPGQETFARPIVHSSEYRNGSLWKGKRVLVVGIGNSGGEVALDLFERGALPGLSVRSAINVVPRDFLGLPILAWGIALNLLPVKVADAIAGLVSRITLGRLEETGLQKLPYGPMAQIRFTGRIPLLDIGTVGRIRRKEIELVPEIESFRPGAIRFAGGVERPFDAVVLATGYQPALASFVEAPGALDAKGMPAKFGAETLPGLYFCGFHIAATGMLREIRLESQRIAGSIAARRLLAA